VPKAHVIGPVSLDVLVQAGYDVERIRSAARPPDDDKWVSIRTTLFGHELGRLPYEYQSPTWTARTRVNLAHLFEAILGEDLRSRPGVDYVVGRWTAVREHADRVVPTAIIGGVETERASRYVLAADGANSAVRAQLGVSLESSGPSTQSLSIHVRADLRRWLDDRHLILALTTDPTAPGGFILYDLSREATFVMHGVGDAGPTPDEAEETVRHAFGCDDVPFQVSGTARWEMAAAVATEFRHGRVFLLGDAAHLVPPTGGLCMNSGIQDSANLAWKIAAVLDGWATDALLDTNESERRPIVVTYARQSNENNDAHEELRRVVGHKLSTRGASPSREEMEGLSRAQWVGFNCPGLQLSDGYGPDAEIEDPGAYTPSAAIGRRLPHVDATTFVSGHRDIWEDRADAADVPVTVVDLDGAVQDAMWLHRTGLSNHGTGLVVRPDAHIVERCASVADWPRAERILGAHAGRGTAFHEQVADV
jgi:2,4-dichlorophenol 6-monooxygenase